MNDLKIIPQKFSFQKPEIKTGNDKIISYGINVEIDIDVFKADKVQSKEDLRSIFVEVLEYFD